MLIFLLIYSIFRHRQQFQLGLPGDNCTETIVTFASRIVQLISTNESSVFVIAGGQNFAVFRVPLVCDQHFHFDCDGVVCFEPIRTHAGVVESVPYFFIVRF